jgi:hypothetical protein
MTEVIFIEYVDHGAQDEYGFFGKVIARSDVRGFSQAEIDAEIAAMRRIVGEHVSTRYVEEIA